jgi:PEP-CTERM motif-containing protein
MHFRTFAVLSVAALLTIPASANNFFFTTGNPDGKIATLSRVGSTGKIETETADDFILSQSTTLTQATFTGLIPTSVPLGSISDVEIEFYRVFPKDSGPFDNRVFTRTNSPADVEVASATRDSAAGTLSYTITLLNPNFTAANSVVNGINTFPNQFTGGEGPVTGQEVLISVNFNTPVGLSADHYFFRPEALVNSGDFLWLSAPAKQFPGDLQTWIRNADLAPDWSRIGTDITGQGPFDASFSLTGTVPEPSTLGLLGGGLTVLAYWRKKYLA